MRKPQETMVLTVARTTTTGVRATGVFRSMSTHVLSPIDAVRQLGIVDGLVSVTQRHWLLAIEDPRALDGGLAVLREYAP